MKINSLNCQNYTNITFINKMRSNDLKFVLKKCHPSFGLRSRFSIYSVIVLTLTLTNIKINYNNNLPRIGAGAESPSLSTVFLVKR